MPSLRQQSEIYIFLTKVKFEFAAIDDYIRRHKMESFELTFNQPSLPRPDILQHFLTIKENY